MRQQQSDATPQGPQQSPEQALWRAVIAQAVTDACYGGRGPVERAEREKARTWLLGRSKDFSFICTLAGLEPDAVYESAQRMADKGWPEQRDRRHHRGQQHVVH